MLSLVLGVIVIGMGIKAMTPAGIPLTRQKQLHGTWAKVAGAFCLLLGLLFLADGGWSLARVARQVADLSADRRPAISAQQNSIQNDVPTVEVRWAPYTTPHGNVSILFPGIPTEVNKGAIEETGVVESYTYTSAFAENALLVSYLRFDSPIDASEAWFDEVRDMVLRIGNVGLASERTLQISDRPAREFLSTPRGGMIVRVLVVADGDRAHQITMAGTKENATSPKMDEVFSSFQVLPPVEKAPPTSEDEPSGQQKQ